MDYNSESTALHFYQQLGADGLRNRTSPGHIEAGIELVEAQSNKDDKILNVACGYGRICIPLAKAGRDISGVDISPEMIQAARIYARSEDCTVPIFVGNMLELAFPSQSFDKVFCLWASFNHLLKRKEQTRALR